MNISQQLNTAAKHSPFPFSTEKFIKQLDLPTITNRLLALYSAEGDTRHVRSFIGSNVPETLHEKTPTGYRPFYALQFSAIPDFDPSKEYFFTPTFRKDAPPPKSLTAANNARNKYESYDWAILLEQQDIVRLPLALSSTSDPIVIGLLALSFREEDQQICLSSTERHISSRCSQVIHLNILESFGTCYGYYDKKDTHTLKQDILSSLEEEFMHPSEIPIFRNPSHRNTGPDVESRRL